MRDSLPLGDLVSLQRGTTYKSELIGEAGPVLLGLGAINRHGGFRNHNFRTYGGPSPEALLVRPGQLFLSLKDVTQTADLLGAVAQVPRKVGVGRLTQDTVRLDIQTNAISTNYLYWMLRTPQYRSYCRSHATGTTNLGLSREALFAFKVPLPDVYRHGLVEVLGALDDKIAANGKLAETADEYLAAQLEMRCRETRGTSIQLGAIATVNGEVVGPVENGHLRYVDIASVGVGSYELPVRTDWGVAPSRARRKISKGDTLWSTVRPNRRSHALNLSEDPLLVGSTGLAVISPRETGFAFLYEATKLPEFTAFLENSTSGTAYPAVRAERFNDAPVPALSSESMDSFEAIAAPLRTSVAAGCDENRALAALRDTLLPHLMSGRLRVLDAEKIVGDGL